MKYISHLTGDEVLRLNAVVKSGQCSRVRHRAHCILLSAKGYKIDEIADIFGADRRTVSAWIDAWEKSGFDGLPDSPRSGRPEKLTEKEKETALKLLRENPRSVRTVIARLAEMTGKAVSANTLKRLAKAAGLIWKRIKKSVRPGRDGKEFRKAEKLIGKLKMQQKRGKADIFYFDETGFDLQPAVPYAWQPEGETVEVPSFRSRRLSVLGFLNTVNSDFQCFTFECSVDSGIVTACFDKFCEHIDKHTFVIIDNASVHTSEKFVEKTEKWAEKGLFIIYLPPYSPELNLIEILWRFIKYLWLPFSAYLSFGNLVEEVEKILKGIGSDYIINFS
jgi:transposase